MRSGTISNWSLWFACKWISASVSVMATAHTKTHINRKSIIWIAWCYERELAILSVFVWQLMKKNSLAACMRINLKSCYLIAHTKLDRCETVEHSHCQTDRFKCEPTFWMSKLRRANSESHPLLCVWKMNWFRLVGLVNRGFQKSTWLDVVSPIEFKLHRI